MAASNINLYVAATVSCLTAALFGYSVGFIGGELVLPSFLRYFDLNQLPTHGLALARSATVTIWIVGALLGVPLAMPICSRFGRLLCIQVAALFYVVGAVCQVLSGKQLVVFLVGRLINGLGVGAGTLASPIYISEISPPSDRGTLMSGYQTALQIGALLGFWAAFIAQQTLSDTSNLQWQIPAGAQVLVGILLAAGTQLIPESPRYLAERGRFEAGAKALSWLRLLSTEDPELRTELDEIESVVHADAVLKRTNFLSELKKLDVRRRLHVGVGLMVAQNMVGLNALNYYAAIIFMAAGFTSVSSSLLLTGLFGVVKLLSAIMFMFVFVRIRGNRFWLKLGTAVCAMSMVVLAYNVRLLPPPGSHNAPLSLGGVISVLMVYVFAFSFGVSLGPISWNVCAEIFPLHINARCCMITTCTQWMFQIIIAAITPPLLARIGWATYLVYACFCAMAFIWVAVFVPETRAVGIGKPMDMIFGVHEDGEDDMNEVSETTALLAHDHRRRSSIAGYV